MSATRKKKPYLNVKQLRLAGIAVLVIAAAILVPQLQSRCAQEDAPASRPETAYFPHAWQRCLAAQDLEDREGALRDNILEKRMGTVALTKGEKELDRIEIHVPYLLYESDKAGSEIELELLLASNEARETVGRVIEALYRFADTGAGTLTPQPEQLFAQILNIMRGGKKEAWVWSGLYCTAEQQMDMLGKTTLVIVAQRMAAWDEE